MDSGKSVSRFYRPNLAAVELYRYDTSTGSYKAADEDLSRLRMRGEAGTLCHSLVEKSHKPKL